jgi:hypothetical protein
MNHKLNIGNYLGYFKSYFSVYRWQISTCNILTLTGVRKPKIWILLLISRRTDALKLIESDKEGRWDLSLQISSQIKTFLECLSIKSCGIMINLKKF